MLRHWLREGRICCKHKQEDETWVVNVNSNRMQRQGLELRLRSDIALMRRAITALTYGIGDTDQGNKKLLPIV